MRPRSWPLPARAALDAGLVGLSLADALWAAAGRHSVALIVSLVAVAALLLRRRFPVLAQALGLPNVVWGFALVAQLITTFSFAHRTRDRRVVAVGVGVIAVAQVLGMLLVPGNSAPTDYTAQEVVFAVLIVGGPVALGLLLRAYGQLSEQMQELISGRRRATELAERTVLAAERTRLAREMHDVVSHQVSLIAVQAGALRMTAPDTATRQTADTLRRLAVKTLAELREMVTVLRQDGQPSTDLAPQPRLADLPRLVRDSGTGATLSMTDIDGREWAEPTERAAYRMVQEGLTNARKHASGAAVSVELAGLPAGLHLRVHNGPPPNGGSALLPGGGQGLIGLRERAELLGGTVAHHATDDGGFELTAVLPARSGRVPAASRSKAAGTG